MKKIALILILCLLLSLFITSCAVKDEESEAYNDYEETEIDTLEKLRQDYPGAQITKEENSSPMLPDIYSVISDNVDYTKADQTERQIQGNKRIYESMEELLSELDPLLDVVFIGKKTGENKQYIPINEDGYVDGIFYTDSKVEVRKVFYGDITEGSTITLNEKYAVFKGEGKSSMLCIDYPLSEEEYLYVCGKNAEESLFKDGDSYYYPIDHCVKLSFYKDKTAADREQMYVYDRICYDLYNKYVVNEDTALDPETEIKKASTGHRRDYLTAEEEQKIKELCQKYGKLEK